MKNRLAAILLTTSFVLPSSAFAESNSGNNGTINNSGIINNGTMVIQFNDIEVNNWAYSAVSNMNKRGVISGYSDGSFHPDDPISREEFAKMISLTFSLDLTDVSKATYSDVTPDRWSFPYIEVTTDYITGYYPPKGIPFFDPTADATREDVATALVKITELGTDRYSTHFTDENQISPGLKKYVDVAADHNLISGYPDGTFRPLNSISRAEAAVLLYRAIKGISGSDTKPANSDTNESADDNGQSASADESAVVQAPDLHVDVIKQSTSPARPTYTSDPISVLIKGETTPGSTVTVNDESVITDQGEFELIIPIQKAGTYDYTIVSSRMGQSTTVKKSITINIDAPKLSLEQPDPQMAGSTVNLWFDWVDVNDSQPTLYVNGEKRSYKIGGGGSKPGSYNGLIELTLQEGENNFTLQVVNRYGLQSNAVTKKYFYQP